MNDKHQLFFPHRRDVSVYNELCLVLPGADDMRVAEIVTFHKVRTT
jgi:hypothetical protein